MRVNGGANIQHINEKCLQIEFGIKVKICYNYVTILFAKDGGIMKKALSVIKDGIVSIFFSIVAICFSALVIINSTWIYTFVIRKYNLESISGVDSSSLMKEYKGLINYLQNPFIDKLSFENFSMSTYGEIHFYEVKKIFLILIIILGIFIFIVGITLLLRRYKKNKLNKLEILEVCNNSTNILIIFFSSIVVLYFIDFSWAFTLFHKIFFRNDYWIFDPKIDPIINVLPEELFMICGVGILVLLFLMIIGVKIIYNKSNKKNVIMNNTTIDV